MSDTSSNTTKSGFGFTGIMAGLLLGIIGTIIFQKYMSGAPVSAAVMGATPTGNTVCGLTSMPASNENRGLIKTQVDFNNETSAYQQAHPQNGRDSVTWGGTIGKEYLIAIINSLGAGTDVKFKFVTDRTQSKTSIYFQGGTFDPVTGAAGTNTLYIRTGNAADAFCPTRCD